MGTLPIEFYCTTFTRGAVASALALRVRGNEAISDPFGPWQFYTYQTSVFMLYVLQISSSQSRQDVPQLTGHMGVPQDRLSLLIRLCLTDSNFPTFVEAVEKELTNLTSSDDGWRFFLRVPDTIVPPNAYKTKHSVIHCPLAFFNRVNKDSTQKAMNELPTSCKIHK